MPAEAGLRAPLGRGHPKAKRPELPTGRADLPATIPSRDYATVAGATGVSPVSTPLSTFPRLPGPPDGTAAQDERPVNRVERPGTPWMP